MASSLRLQNQLMRELNHINKFLACKNCVCKISRSALTNCNTVNEFTKTSEKNWIKPEGYETGIRIHNSLTNKKEPLVLPRGQLASWYACGPTVYDHAHIGHASSYVRQDVIRRVIENFYNIDVVMLMGITDIDDKIIKRSNELNINYKELAKTYEESFFNDMKRLNVMQPTLKTRVTEHIPQIIQFIQKIFDEGYAYRTTSGVYFDVHKFGRYNRLVSHHTEFEHSEDQDSEKKHTADFALWKAAKVGEPSWESPWDPGRPGWHIECSTMASFIFGKTIDIHSGGEDLKFPHHENEIAQSEAHFGCSQWTNYWLHTGHLHLKDDVKMSKSLNNTILISDLLQQYTANQFRLFCMMRPYNNRIEYSRDDMEQAVRIDSKWSSFLSSAMDYIAGNLECGAINEAYLLHSLQKTKENVASALSDDFDTRRAINAVDELVKRCNKEMIPKAIKVDCPRSPGTVAAVAKYLQNLFTVLGFTSSNQKANVGSGGLIQSELIDAAIRFREEVRKFALVRDTDTQLSGAERKEIMQRNKPLLKHCDQLRKDWHDCGIAIKDQADGTTWDFVTKPKSTSN